MRLLTAATGIAALAGLAFLAWRSGTQSPGASPSSKSDQVARPVIQVQDVDGWLHTPLSPDGAKATLLFFLLTDCPISNSYAPEIQRICAEYARKGIAAFIVQADPDITAAQAKQHATEYGLTAPVLLDPDHSLVKIAGVTMAPEVAVLVDERVLYRGRIDDRYVDYGKRRAEPTQRDLRDALDAILQGKPVPTPVTEPIGCHLPDSRRSSDKPDEQ